MEQRRNSRAEETGDPRENPPTNVLSSGTYPGHLGGEGTACSVFPKEQVAPVAVCGHNSHNKIAQGCRLSGARTLEPPLRANSRGLQLHAVEELDETVFLRRVYQPAHPPSPAPSSVYLPYLNTLFGEAVTSRCSLVSAGAQHQISRGDTHTVLLKSSANSRASKEISGNSSHCATMSVYTAPCDIHLPPVSDELTFAATEVCLTSSTPHVCWAGLLVCKYGRRGAALLPMLDSRRSCSPDFRTWGSCRRMSLVGGISWGLPFLPSMHSDVAPHYLISLSSAPKTSIAGTKRWGKRKTYEKTRLPVASSRTIPTCENLGATPPGIEPASPTSVYKNLIVTPWNPEEAEHTRGLCMLSSIALIMLPTAGCNLDKLKNAFLKKAPS
ncbi:hypothetical protein PR048_007405 [Dryococelus australis]|uniref:Uncharacterized protein n=1 Tax=Dryococelus australis TaxID=614101 RepID=A0ABQ9HU92_9NEOP|nr:hypothetical protein PR048_007405 [Dryococelus australis]